MKPFAPNGSPTSHGGVVYTSQNRLTIDSSATLLAGDSFYCPQCKCTSKIRASHDFIIVDGQPVAFVGDYLTCGAKLLDKQQHLVVADYSFSYGSTSTQQSSYTQQSYTNSFANTSNSFTKNTAMQPQEQPCTHTDGAIKVAEYIVKEIKINVRSKPANDMRYFLDYQQKRIKEWQKLPIWKQVLVPAPIPNSPPALALWTEQVYKGHIWDHKHLIRDNLELNKVAVLRKLDLIDIVRKKKKVFEETKISEKKPQNSKRYWHKYKDHDYFLDVWSNIHYGYVGLACGFTEDILNVGADVAQALDNLGVGVGDAPDDVMCVKIGFALYKKFGTYAEGLTAQHVLDALEQANLTASRDIHLCIHPNKSELKNDN